MSSNILLAVPALMTGILLIPVLVGTLDKDPARRRDARRVLTELIRLVRRNGSR
jgi:hypothetical protein